MMLTITYRPFFQRIKSVPWTGFLILWSVLSMATVWFYQDQFTTRQTVEQLLGAQFSPVYIDLIYARIQDITYWTLLCIPCFILIRMTLMALLIHLFFILTQVWIPFKRVFHAIVPAFGFLILRDVSKFIPLSGMDTLDDKAGEVLKVPLALSAVVSVDSYPTLNKLLNAFNCFEGVWLLWVVLTLAVWTGLNMRKILFPLLTARILGIVLMWGLGVFYEIYML
ncbi:hypothetical protein [Fidelibacter multiformis]|uniref:hypothetical protein n=1 Tax=Fidelibacter multiformis TaxID=3377529 RepID=UPI0037DCD770